MIKTIVIIFFIQFTLQQCNKGCLRCAPNDQCLICDFNNFYILNNDSKQCEIKEIENCQQIDFQGNCLLCQSGFFIDQGKCVKVETPIQNCERYFSQKTCLLCQTNYALILSECVSAIQISGCAHQLNDISKCYECQENKILSIEQKQCLDIEQFEKENCQSFNFVDCLECRQGYKLNKNNYLVQTTEELKSENSKYILSLEYAYQVFKKQGQSNFSKCSKIKVENCQKYISFDKCEVCNKGYFLTTSKNCQKNPIDNIQHCEIYSSKNQCKQCRNEYYMKSENVCIATTQINNCVDYHREQDGVCINCEDKYYSEGSSCTLRQFSVNITNCIVKNNIKDSCSTCADGFVTSLDGLICLNAIPFCIEYEKQKNSISCIKCEQNYFLKNKICFQGQIENCLEYENETQCKVCQNQYHLNIEKKCSSNFFFENLKCLESDSSQKNYCIKCPSNRVKINLNGVCQPVQNQIQNCYKYSDAFNCIQCKSEYSYLQNNICKLGTIKNCNKYHPNKNMCLSCQFDYNNNKYYTTYPKSQENNKCVEINPNINQNCSNLENQNDNIICSQCIKNYYPFTFSSEKIFFCVPENFYMINQQVNIDFCLTYDSQQNKCLRCEKGKFLSKDGICQQECSQGYLVTPFKLNTSFQTNVFSELFFKCVPNTEYPITGYTKDPLECTIIDTQLVNNKAVNYCGYCSKNQVGELLIRTSIVKLDYLPVLDKINRNNNNIILPVQRCLNRQITVGNDTSFLQTKVVLYQNSNNQIPANLQNCRYVKQIDNGKYGCIACNHGYSGKVVYDINKNGFFIGKCEQIQNCVSQTYYQAVGSGKLQFDINERIFPVSFFLSCHFCKNNLIPTIGVLMTSQTATSTLPASDQFFYYQFYLPATENKTPIQTAIDKKDTIPVTTCQENGLGKNKILNCAVQEVAIDRVLKLNAQNYSEMNPRCIACLPGYKPTWISITTQTDKSNYIKECTAIDNCNFQKTLSFNKCDLCRGFSSLVYDSNDVNLTLGLECRISGLANCLIYDFTNKECKICSKGYAINTDKICDLVESYKCVNKGFYDAMNSQIANVYGWEGLGCLECEEHFIGIQFFQKQTQCIQNFFLSSGRSLPSSKILINFCQNYGPISGEINKVLCIQCIQNYVLSQSGKECFIKNDKFTNCKRYSEDGKRCAVCDSLYYLDSNGFCREGQIKNCLVYQNQFICAQCNSDYILIKKKTKQICLEAPQLNCQVFDQISLNSSKLQCSICSKDHYHSSNVDQFGQFPLNFCGLIPDIQRCIQYETEPNIQQANLDCQLCEKEYYSNNGICQIRQNYPISNCKVYNPKEDNCQECNNKFFLNDKKFCEVFPSGIVSCQDYFNEITCIRCLPNKYQKGDVCIEVPESSLIENCEYYESDLTCSECKVDYYLKSSKECIQASAKNCLEYTDENTCKSCQENYGLMPSGNITSCIEIKLQNCEIPNTTLINGNFTCKKCKVSFYKNSGGECIAVPQLIKYCMFYDSKDTCQTCLDGYVIAKDKKSCLIDDSLIRYADPFCQISFETSSPICNTCKPGYLFDDSEDSKCVKCNEQIDQGCMLCDINDRAQCLICQQGYYMNAEGRCNSQIETEVQQTIKGCELYILFSWLVLWFNF